MRLRITEKDETVEMKGGTVVAFVIDPDIDDDDDGPDCATVVVGKINKVRLFVDAAHSFGLLIRNLIGDEHDRLIMLAAVQKAVQAGLLEEACRSDIIERKIERERS